MAPLPSPSPQTRAEPPTVSRKPENHEPLMWPHAEEPTPGSHRPGGVNGPPPLIPPSQPARGRQSLC
jgi:hypothetical protein